MLEISPLIKGLSLVSATGSEETLLVPGRATLIHFYRGHWCPFCMTYLEDLDTFQERMSAVGAVRCISSDTLPQIQATVAGHRLRVPLLSDPQFQAIDAFGVRHAGGGPGRRDIARPAVFVIDLQCVVTYQHIGKHPLDRPLLNNVAAELERAAGSDIPPPQAGRFDGLQSGGGLFLGALRRGLRGATAAAR